VYHFFLQRKQLAICDIGQAVVFILSPYGDVIKTIYCASDGVYFKVQSSDYSYGKLGAIPTTRVIDNANASKHQSKRKLEGLCFVEIFQTGRTLLG
jgi:hypothetical protein